MRLIYHDESHGRNFGDLLNPYIFNHFLPGYFDKDDGIDLLGIGSILGLSFAKGKQRKVVFSSGFAYGSAPEIDDSYHFLCVRGPLTAKTLGLDPALAIVDGAYLLQGMPITRPAKKYRCSVMFHWHSLKKFNWQPLCEEAGIHFIDPTGDIHEIIQELLASELVLAEAMHAAIVCDALRIPWHPIAAYGGVNNIKWSDFCNSLELEYSPSKIRSLYVANDFTDQVFRKKLPLINSIQKGLGGVLFGAYSGVQRNFTVPGVIKELRQLSEVQGTLSKDSVSTDRFGRLAGKLQELKTLYPLH